MSAELGLSPEGVHMAIIMFAGVNQNDPEWNRTNISFMCFHILVTPSDAYIFINISKKIPSYILNTFVSHYMDGTYEYRCCGISPFYLSPSPIII